MKTAVFEDWHVWEGTNGVLMSDERTKTLRQFSNIDVCVNWLYLNDKKQPPALSTNRGKGTNHEHSNNARACESSPSIARTLGIKRAAGYLRNMGWSVEGAVAVLAIAQGN